VKFGLFLPQSGYIFVKKMPFFFFPSSLGAKIFDFGTEKWGGKPRFYKY
jgi:hypothetical protein